MLLDKKSWKLLKALYSVEFLDFPDVASITGHSALDNNDPVVKNLVSKKLIQDHKSGFTAHTGEDVIDGYCITLDGAAYRESVRKNLLGFLLPYAITTLIALLSLAGTLAEHWPTIMAWFSAPPRP